MRSLQSLVRHSYTTRIVGTLGFGLLSAALYVVRIPLMGTPVPLIVQPFTSFLASIVLGPWYGLLSQLVMLSVLPFTLWAPLGGVSMLWGPTSGYIWGFVFAGTIASLLIRPRFSRQTNALIFLGVTLTCLHIPGMLVLRSWYWFIGSTLPSWSLLFHQAITPFLLGGTLKAACAAFIFDRTHSSHRR